MSGSTAGAAHPQYPQPYPGSLSFSRTFVNASAWDGSLTAQRDILGPTQTAASVKGLSRKQVAWLNLHHVSEERLDKAIFRVVNSYNRFVLPQFWGTGKSASADGTKWNLYEQNLLSEYHIRYGGYGGIGYAIAPLMEFAANIALPSPRVRPPGRIAIIVLAANTSAACLATKRWRVGFS